MARQKRTLQICPGFYGLNGRLHKLWVPLQGRSRGLSCPTLRNAKEVGAPTRRADPNEPFVRD